MKKKCIMKRFLCCFLTCILLVNVLTLPVNAAEISNVEKMSSYVNIIEKDLEESGGSVIIGFDKLISELTLKKATLTDKEQIENADRLISLAESYKSNYMQIKNGITPCGNYYPVYSEAVSAVISYFSFYGYFLASELLLHASDLEVYGTVYTNPMFIDRIIQSERVKYVKYLLYSNGPHSGSLSFESDSTDIVKMDLYYAIHDFSYYPLGYGTNFLLYDRYDFALGDYSGIAGVAIDAMFMAQQYGVIIPFNLEIFL